LRKFTILYLIYLTKNNMNNLKQEISILWQMTEHILSHAKENKDVVLSANISNIRLLLKSLIDNQEPSMLKLIRDRINDIIDRYNIK